MRDGSADAPRSVLRAGAGGNREPLPVKANGQRRTGLGTDLAMLHVST